MCGPEEYFHEGESSWRHERGVDILKAEEDGQEHAEPQNPVQRDAGKQRIRYDFRCVMDLFGHL